jgi:hypothetical protein
LEAGNWKLGAGNWKLEHYKPVCGITISLTGASPAHRDNPCNRTNDAV